MRKIWSMGQLALKWCHELAWTDWTPLDNYNSTGDNKLQKDLFLIIVCECMYSLYIALQHCHCKGIGDQTPEYKCDNTKLMMIQILIFATAKPIPFGGYKVFYEVTGWGYILDSGLALPWTQHSLTPTACITDNFLQLPCQCFDWWGFYTNHN